jgi:hypothetical protein
MSRHRVRCFGHEGRTSNTCLVQLELVDSMSDHASTVPVVHFVVIVACTSTSAGSACPARSAVLHSLCITLNCRYMSR